MKKSLAILILLTVTVILLCSTAGAARPATVTKANAGVRVAISGGSTYYFETLTPELFLWLSTENSSNSTVTLLKDLSLSSKEGTNFLSLGQAVGDVPAIVVDLGGYNITYSGPSNLFAIPYDGDLTVKNGSIYYTCVGNTRCPFVLGATSSQQCDPADAQKPVTPSLILENMTVYSSNPETGRVINCFQWMARIEVKNSFLWTSAVNSAAIDMRKSTQKDSEIIQWRGEYDSSVSLEDSTVGTAGSYALAAADDCVFTANETTLVSTVAIKDPTTPGTVDGVGQMTTGQWKGLAPDGSEIRGTAFAYAMPKVEEVPPMPEYSSGNGIPEWFNPPDTGVSITGLVAPAALSLFCAAAVLPKKRRK